jgi:cyclopropane-fatty-acyl-phospholipid synthase
MNLSPNTKTPTKDAAPKTNLQGTNRIQNRLGGQSTDRHPARTTSSLAFALLRRVLDQCGNPPIRCILSDGHEITPSATEPVGSIRFVDNRTVWALALDPLFQFGEAYANGRLVIEGDLPEMLSVLYREINRNSSFDSPGRRLLTRLRRPNPNSLKGSQQNIKYHYDIGNDFYRLWLDEEMIYTCAYFARPSMTLEEAQFAKLDHVCRKLQLKPGMEVVEAGCGWGALAIHMARHYGVHVKAFNISSEQIAWARNKAQQARLGGQVEFVQDDWRNIRGRFDAFVSVGMLEHVGVANYQQLGAKVRESLTPDGIGLIHSIGQNSPAPFNPWIERRIFPGAYPPSLAEIMGIFEPNGLSILDVENLRLHYAETLRHWLRRFEDSVDTIRDEFDERFIRMWRMYLAGSVASFETGFLQLFQVVFAKDSCNNIPRTREHVYDIAGGDEWQTHPKSPPENWQMTNTKGSPS